jgi:hypothetical protein
VRAPASAVRFAATAVAESDSGIVRTVSIMWRTPPVNIRSWVLLVWGEKRRDRGQWNCHEGERRMVGARRTAVTTVLFVNKPLKISTLEPLSSPSTLCPPVTFAYVVLVNSVGTNAGVVLKADAGTVPFRTW